MYLRNISYYDLEADSWISSSLCFAVSVSLGSINSNQPAIDNTGLLLVMILHHLLPPTFHFSSRSSFLLLMLFFANSRGIYVGAIGGSLVIIDAIIITVGLSAVETESLVLVASGYMLQGLMSTCGIFCTVLPLLPLFFSGLKAALNNQSGLNVKTRIPDNSSEE